MKKIKMTFLKMKVIFTVLLVSGLATAADDLKDDVDVGASEREAGAMWFGPRVGKRSLRIANDDNRTFLRLLEAADALKYYYDQLPFYQAQPDDPETRVTKKVVFTPKLGRSLYQDKKIYENVEFTPRLGRRIPDALPVTPSDDDVFKPDPGQVDRRTSYFSPRLGRKVNFSPRLGRELSYDVYPEKIRLVRSANDTKTT